MNLLRRFFKKTEVKPEVKREEKREVKPEVKREEKREVKREVERRRFVCQHKTTGIEYNMECCGVWHSCGNCHKEKCDKYDLYKERRFRLRCLGCKVEQGYGDTCMNCGMSMGNYCCVVCEIIIDNPENGYRHCDKCGVCVLKGYKHCDRCDTCLCYGDKCYRSNECSICFEEIEIKRVLDMGMIKLKCGHKFHDNCYDKWSRNTCPLCRCSSDVIKRIKPLESKSG